MGMNLSKLLGEWRTASAQPGVLTHSWGAVRHALATEQLQQSRRGNAKYSNIRGDELERCRSWNQVTLWPISNEEREESERTLMFPTLISQNKIIRGGMWGWWSYFWVWWVGDAWRKFLNSVDQLLMSELCWELWIKYVCLGLSP